MKITGFGNASVSLEIDDQILFFDPYLKDSVPVIEPLQSTNKRREALSKAKNILITHGHFDHLGSIYSLYHEQNVRIFCTETPSKTLQKQGFPKNMIQTVTPGEALRFGDISVSAYHTEHCHFNFGKIKEVVFHHHIFRQFRQFLHLISLNIKCPSGGECLLYEIEGNDKRIQLLGSAGLDEDTAYPEGADILILPYQGRSDMTSYCMKIIQRLKPKEVLINHYDDAFPPITCLENTDLFVESMKKEYPQIPCQTINEFESIEY